MKLTPIQANLNEIETDKGLTILFSYKTPVAAHIQGMGFFRTEKKWSVTTSRHINKWLTRENATPEKVMTKPQEWFDALV